MICGDVLAVDVLHALDQLGHVVAGLRLRHRHPALQDVDQISKVTEDKNWHHVGGI